MHGKANEEIGICYKAVMFSQQQMAVEEMYCIMKFKLFRNAIVNYTFEENVDVWIGEWFSDQNKDALL